jgi:hypothetical protein
MRFEEKEYEIVFKEEDRVSFSKESRVCFGDSISVIIIEDFRKEF